MLLLEGPPAQYVFQHADGHRFRVPVWMTEPAAADISIAGDPYVAVEHLLGLARLVQALRAELHAAPRERDGGANTPRKRSKTPSPPSTALSANDGEPAARDDGAPETAPRPPRDHR